MTGVGSVGSGVFGVLRIEETWRLWSKFLDDHSGFEDWLKSAERTAAQPESAHVLYTAAKEELKKFEVSEVPPDQQSPTCGPGTGTGPRVIGYRPHRKNN